jgi:nitric oxide dioxygenase
MLTDQDIATVKATAPLVAQHAVEITSRFYPRMFGANPEVLNFFNMAHQRTESQPRALAGAICAYAANIDRLDRLGAAVELIAQKHCALEIRPDQYPIVGRHLLAAIRDVLGDAASDPVLQAWERAYLALADILIAREAEIYEAQGSGAGGWTGRRRFIVDRKVRESDEIASFYLHPEDRGALADFRPGQYLTVHVDLPGIVTPPRNYSLSDRPGLNYYRISVKREAAPSGAADAPPGLVSNYLHDCVQAGDVLEIGPPCGNFFLEADGSRPVVLLSGGVGLTPMLSMLHTLAEEGPDVPVWFIHGARNGRVHALRGEVERACAADDRIQARFAYSDPTPEDLERGHCDRTGLIDLDWLQELLPGNDCDFYFCGPRPFMRMIYRDLRRWDVPEDRIHFEFFGPREEIEDAAAVEVG